MQTAIQKWYEFRARLQRTQNFFTKLVAKFLFWLERNLDGILSIICLADEIQDELNKELYENFKTLVIAIRELLKKLIKTILRILDYLVGTVDYIVHKGFYAFIFSFDKILQSALYILSFCVSLIVLLLYVFSPLILYNLQSVTFPFSIPDTNLTDVSPKIDMITIILLLLVVIVGLLPMFMSNISTISTKNRNLTFTELTGKEPPLASKETLISVDKPNDSDKA